MGLRPNPLFSHEIITTHLYILKQNERNYKLMATFAEILANPTHNQSETDKINQTLILTGGDMNGFNCRNYQTKERDTD